MDAFITHKRIGGLNAYRKPIIAAIIVTMIMGIFAGCEDGYTPTLKEPIKATAPTSAEIVELSSEIKQLVKGLGYSDKVAQDFAQMVGGWKDKQGQPVLFVWKKKLAEAKENYKRGKISKAQLATAEQNIAKEIGQRVQKEISYNVKFFDLADVVKHRQTQCLGYTQLFYLLGNSIGLPVKAIDVLEQMTPGPLPTGMGHIACIVNLADDKTIMIDLVPGGFMSTPFIIEKELTKVGNYWELKEKYNPLGIHRRVQILDRNGLIAGIYNNRGNAHGKLGQYIQAISDCTKAIELNPKYAEAYNNRGASYAALGQHTKAISDYTKAIELNPKYAEAYNNRGLTYADLCQNTKAISDYTKAIELNPKLAEAYTNRGNAYFGLGQHTQAISDYTKAIELNPKLAEAYNNRGIAYRRLDQHTKAISDYTKAIELNPKDSEAYYNRGIAYRRLDQYTQAISDYTKVIELNPKDAKAYYNRGTIYVNLGKHTQAISDCTKAIELNPKYAKAYYNRGIVYYELGQHTQAISDYTKAIELNPKDAKAYNNRGVAYVFLGKFEEAKKDLLKAVELNPALKPLVKRISYDFKLNLKLD